MIASWWARTRRCCELAIRVDRCTREAGADGAVAVGVELDLRDGPAGVGDGPIGGRAEAVDSTWLHRPSSPVRRLL